MHRTEGANNLAGMFTDGPPGTTVEEDWLNAIQEEIIAVLTAAGINPLTAITDTRVQLATAIAALIPDLIGTAQQITVTSGAGTITLSIPSGAVITFAGGGGINILDTDTSHTLSIVLGSNLTSNRTLNIVTGDATRTLTISGDVTLTVPIAVNMGGTGATALTDHGILLGSGTSGITPTAVMTDGQILVGDTAADPQPRTLSGDIASVSDTGAVAIASNIKIKGWANFDNAGTLNDSYNVASITDTAAGRWSVVWDTDFANDDYVWTASAFINADNAYICGDYNEATPAAYQTTALVKLICNNTSGATADPTQIEIIAIGDQ